MLDEVGPAKPSGRLRRLVLLACYLAVILAGLLVVTEVTGATRIIDSIASLLHSRVGGAHLTVHVTAPSINFAIDGRAFPPRTGYFDYFFPGRTSGFVVESFKNGRKVSGMHFSARPNLSIELEIDRDGQILVEYEGPIRTPKPRREPTFPRNIPGHPTDPVLRGDSSIHETDTIPPVADGRPIDVQEGLKADTRWNAAVVSEANARASLEKAVASRDLARGDFERMKALGEQGAVESKRVEEAELRLSTANVACRSQRPSLLSPRS